ncbi:hypothetical protein [Aliterella atlantica]|uniref:hypothetical protein n=1 Tax=Aliterella atlantica TaxID=1827278 RepID=UPI0013649E63|nr:hypothetical protein [Aliterella atlantica]
MGFFRAKKDLEDFDGFQVYIPCLLMVLTTRSSSDRIQLPRESNLAIGFNWSLVT